jgi:hypothetical protein
MIYKEVIDKGADIMTQSKSQKERQFRTRKEAQNPHGKVKSFDELGEGVAENNKNNNNR